MASDAKACRETLSGLARAKARERSFERRHGELISGQCEAAKSRDLLLLGHHGTHRRSGQIVLIAPAISAAQAAPRTSHPTHIPPAP